MMNFDYECRFCTTANTCALGHTSCDSKCLDFESDDYSGENSTNDDYKYDAYDWFDDYLDDLNDGEIPDDDDW